MNLLNSSYADIENYLTMDNDGKSLLQFAESCYHNLLKYRRQRLVTITNRNLIAFIITPCSPHHDKVLVE